MKCYKFVKRALDLLLSYFGLIVSYLPMLIISVLILVTDGRPIIFKQVRIGLDGRPFVCYKFRTMRTDAPKSLSTEAFVNADKYITKIGAYLRKMSLDELPQLLNVLSGDMSIVGPRPLIPEEKTMHTVRKTHGVYKMRPGITGLAQICGRDRLPDARKLECDIIYTENLSLLNDLRILRETLLKIISSDGVKTSVPLDTKPS